MLTFVVISLVYTARVQSSSAPVLLWESSPLSKRQDLVPALGFMSTVEFSNRLFDKVNASKPLVVVFIESNLCVEDFSRKYNGRGVFTRVQNLTSSAVNVEFIPSVNDPVAAITDLTSREYSYVIFDGNDTSFTKQDTVLEVNLPEPFDLEDRHSLLRSHDALIAQIYTTLLSNTSDIIAIYTGRSCPWVTHRIVREAAENDSLIIYSRGTMRILSAPYPVLEMDGKKTVLNWTFVTIGYDGPGFSHLGVIYKNDKMRIAFTFMYFQDDHRFKVDQILLENGTNRGILLRSTNTAWTRVSGGVFSVVGDYVFQNGTTSLTFYNFTGTFGGMIPALPKRPTKQGGTVKVVEDETVFFTPAIWMGIIVTFVLGLILAWGVTMLLDIQSVDRFDDPKGKTITVTTVD